MLNSQSVNQVVSIMPPFSSRVSDYTTVPNKILDIITVNASELDKNDIYLEGSIRGVNSEVEVYTKPGHKPLVPITLKRMPAGPFLPYTLQYNDVRQIFDDQWLLYRGITRDQVLKEGLPEGSYQICFRIFNYNTGQPITEYACSNMFTVSSIEPPIIIQPMNKSEIPFMHAQSLVFSWVTPPGAPITTQYKLRIVELNANGPNPADALRSTGYPVFFETMVTGNTYLYSVANPRLTEGKNYAFILTAIDPQGRTSFRNKGASEIYSFTYKAPQQVMSGSIPSPPPSPPPAPPEIPAALAMNTIKGVLKYKYKDDGSQPNEAIALGNAKIKVVVKYVRKRSGTTEFKDIYSENIEFNGETLIANELMDVKTTNQNGEFSFSFLSNYKTGLLGTIDCGDAAYNFLDKENSDLAYFSGNNKSKGGPNIGDELPQSPGNILPDYREAFSGSCELYRYYAIEIESPHDKYYLNPNQEDKYFLAPEIGKTTDMGVVISLVKSIDLDIEVKSKKSDYSTVNSELGLPGMSVFLFRKLNFDLNSIFPMADVIPNKSDKFPPPIGGMILVAQGVTVEKGIAHLKRFVFSDHPQYQYYLFVNGTGSNYNYEMDAPQRIDFKTIKGLKDDGYQTNYTSFIKEHSARIFFSTNKTFTVPQALTPRYPSLKINVKERDGQKLVTNANLVLTETYKFGRFYYNPHENDVRKVWKLHHQLPMAMVDSAYRLNDLWIEVAEPEIEVLGPKREVTVICPGFVDTTFDVKSGTPLKMGELFTMDIQLRYGARVSGIVTDGETKKPIANASVGLAGTATVKTDNNGHYSFESRLLNIKKKLVFSMADYEPDTVEVYVNQKDKKISHALFKKMRRLDVQVWSSGKGLPEMAVTLPNVMVSKVNHVNYSVPSYINLSSVVINSQENNDSQSSELVKIEKPSINTDKTMVVATQNGGQEVAINSNLGQSSTSEDLIPYTEFTDANGYAHFRFTSGSGDMFRVVVTNPESNTTNYPTLMVDASVPYAKYPAQITLNAIEGSCLNGTVYLGASDGVPAEGAEARATIHGQAEDYTVSAKTDKTGKFFLKNLPSSIDSKSGRLTLEIIKSGNVGSSDKNYTLMKGSVCKQESFHLKTIAGIDPFTFLGFPFDLTGWEEASDGNGGYITGKIHITANNRFSSSDLIEIKHLQVIKSSVMNKDGVALAEPKTLPVIFDVQHFKIGIWNTFKGIAVDSSGIKIAVADKQTLAGNIDAKVLIYYKSSADINNFGGYGYDLPTLYLANAPSGTKKTTITVFNSANKFSWPNAGGGTGFYIAAGASDSVRYSIDGFTNAAFADPSKSYFDKNGLILFTRLKAVIPSLNPSNLKIEVGNLSIGKNGITISNPQPFGVQMGNWKLNCTNWTIGNEGLKVSNSILSTGLDIQIENLKFTSSQLETNKSTVHLEKLKLLGVKDINLNTSSKGFNYLYLHDGVYGWQVYANPDPGKTSVGYVQGLPGIEPSDKVEFSSIAINSEGESYFVLASHPFKLFNLVNFTPHASSYMYVYPTFFKISGVYDFGIPYYEKEAGAMAYFKDGNNLAFKLMDMNMCNFDHKSLQYRLSVFNLTNQLLTIKGIVEEPGTLPQIKVTLSHTPYETKIAIDQGEKLELGPGKNLANLTGGINITNHQWDTFRFEGDLKGMGSIPSQKMAFVAEGAVKASDQNISVSEIPAFPGMTFTYDMQNSRFMGTASLDMDLGGMKLSGNVTSMMDSKGWIFQAAGNMEVPGLGSANLYGLFGNYTGIPAEVSAKIGNARCLPNDFKQNMHGFFLSAGITKQVLPKLDWNFALVSVKAGVDLSIDARSFMTFGHGGAVFGLGVLAEGHAYASGKLEVTCTSASADASIQVGISGDYNLASHAYNIDGCASVALSLSAMQCAGVMGVCSGACVSVSLPKITIGASMHLDNSNGFSMGITTESCDQQCK